MKDKFTEDIIKKERNDGNIVIIVFFVVLSVLCFLLNMFRILPGGYILCLISGFLAYYFASKQNVEYEFTMANESVEIDAIYNKQRRKSIVKFNLQETKVVAPTKSPRLEHERESGIRTLYFVSGLKEKETYSILGEYGGIKTEFVIEPTEKILEHVKYICKNICYEE